MDTLYLGYQAARGLIGCLPAGAGFGLAERLADCSWRSLPQRRRVVADNLSLLVGRDVPQSSPSVREVFRNFARYLVEFFTFHRVKPPSVAVEGDGHLQHVRRRGAILLSAHVGNWEVGAALIRRMGWPVAAVALPHPDAGVNQLFDSQRRRCGITVIPLGPHAARRSLERLRAGGLLGLMGDQEYLGRSVAAPFCGRTVRLPRGPAILSLRAQVPVVPTFLIRQGLWKFRLCFERPIWPGARADDGAVQALTQTYAAILEAYAKRVPEQWLRFEPIDATR